MSLLLLLLLLLLGRPADPSVTMTSLSSAAGSPSLTPGVDNCPILPARYESSSSGGQTADRSAPSGDLEQQCRVGRMTVEEWPTARRWVLLVVIVVVVLSVMVA